MHVNYLHSEIARVDLPPFKSSITRILVVVPTSSSNLTHSLGQRKIKMPPSNRIPPHRTNWVKIFSDFFGEHGNIVHIYITGKEEVKEDAYGMSGRDWNFELGGRP